MVAAMIDLMSATLASASSGGGGPVWLLILGPAGAAGLYFGFWRYYRNTDKSHSFERETRITAQPVTGHDAKVNEITGTKKTSIDGDNSSDHRQRVTRMR